MKQSSYFLTEFQRDVLRGLCELKVLAVIIMILLFAHQWDVMSNVNAVKTMATDAMDKLNEISVSIDPEDAGEPPADTISVHILTPDERDLVCRVVAAEARGEDLQGMMAVTQTILDRSELWNQSVTEVVTAPGQYADPYRGDISDEIYLAVADVFDGGIRVFEEPTTHFADGDPYWAEDKTCRGSIGRHTFWY